MGGKEGEGEGKAMEIAVSRIARNSVCLITREKIVSTRR